MIDANVNGLYEEWVKLDKDTSISEDDFVMVSDSKKIDEATLNTIIAQLKTKDLSKIKTAEDVINAIAKMIPGAEISATQQAEIKEKLERFMRNEKIKGHARVALALALTAGAWYFGGPLGDVAARSIFSSVYSAAFGIPSTWSASYWLAYRPMLSHVGNLGYQYGAPVLTAVAGPVCYGVATAAKYTASKVIGAGSYLLARQRQQPAQDFKMKATEVSLADDVENKENIVTRPRSKTM